MRRIFHCTIAALCAAGHCFIAALCAAGACAFIYLSFTQSFFNIVFAATGCCLTYWQIERYRESAVQAKQYRKECVKGCGQPYEARHINTRREEEIIRLQAEFMRKQEAINRFYRENAQLLSRLEREYRSYIAQEYARQENMPEALSAATDRMMSKYGHGIYPAFRDRTAMLCLSPSLYVANLEAAQRFVSTVRI